MAVGGNGDECRRSRRAAIRAASRHAPEHPDACGSLARRETRRSGPHRRPGRAGSLTRTSPDGFFMPEAAKSSPRFASGLA